LLEAFFVEGAVGFNPGERGIITRNQFVVYTELTLFSKSVQTFPLKRSDAIFSYFTPGREDA